MKLHQGQALALFGLSLALLSGPASWPARAAAPSGTIVLMGYGGLARDNYTKAVIAPFMKRYPDINVVYDVGGNSAQMLGRLRAERAHPQIDVDIMDFSVSRIANAEGLFAPLDPQVVTNLADIYPQAIMPGHDMGPGIDFDNLVLIYNRAKFKTPPAGIKDLLDPANRGEVVFSPAPNVIGIALQIVVAHYLGLSYKGSPAPEIAVLKKIAKNVQTWNAMPDNYTMVINGDATLGVGWNARAQTYIDKTGGKLGSVVMHSGGILDIDTINLVARAPNPAAAQLFIDYALGPHPQERYAELMYYGPTNKKAVLPPAIMARTSSYPPTLAKMLPVDWAYVASVQDDWSRLWQREVVPVH